MTERARRNGHANHRSSGDEWVPMVKSGSAFRQRGGYRRGHGKTDPDAPRHEQYSTFIVELLNPGYEICATSKPCSCTVT